jgi:hypothetical protein
MKLEYAVVSSNSNPEYLDFWPYVARAWKNLIGLEPVLLYIDSKPPPDWIHNHGKVYYLESLKDWDIAQQAQCIRFWAANILDKPFIISDMDMLPISKDYYINHAEYIGDSGLISYSSDIIKYRWYRTNPQYPMCYLAGDPKSFCDALELREESHLDFLARLKRMNLRSGTDQKFFYNQVSGKRFNNIKHLERGWIEEKYAVGRLDKAIWPKSDYNAAEYIDCHLPRPYHNSKSMCDLLFKKLNLEI